MINLKVSKSGVQEGKINEFSKPLRKGLQLPRVWLFGYRSWAV